MTTRTVALTPVAVIAADWVAFARMKNAARSVPASSNVRCSVAKQGRTRYRGNEGNAVRVMCAYVAEVARVWLQVAHRTACSDFAVRITVAATVVPAPVPVRRTNFVTWQDSVVRAIALSLVA